MVSIRNKIEEVVNNRFFRITQNQKSTIYQYRSLQGFWAIVKSDSFWATNARFSNDDEEQKLGIELGKKFLEIDKFDQAKLLEDCYIVCFCGEDDCLSQWRGYAKEGVSIGFDFSNIRPFYIEKGEETTEVYNTCGQIVYVNKEIQELDFKEKFALEFGNLEQKVEKEERNKILAEIIPFIKHAGFKEEKEYRLVFTDKKIERYVQYKSEHEKEIPYIVVKMGTTEGGKSEEVYIRVVLGKENSLKSRMCEILNSILSNDSEINGKVIDCGEYNPIGVCNEEPKECIACVKMNLAIPLDSDAEQEWCKCGKNKESHYCKENAIYISDCKNQEHIFEVIYDKLHNEFGEATPKIWCEGHLPIRTIRVAPSARKKEIQESIEHFCKHTYWLKCVDVLTSDIPYRNE